MEKDVENNKNEKTEKENEGKMQAFSYLAISRRPSPENCRRRRKNEGTKLGFEDEDAVKIRLWEEENEGREEEDVFVEGGRQRRAFGRRKSRGRRRGRESRENLVRGAEGSREREREMERKEMMMYLFLI